MPVTALVHPGPAVVTTDDANALVNAAVVDIYDVTAAECENCVDAFTF
jgi:hypothetical protein